MTATAPSDIQKGGYATLEGHPCLVDSVSVTKKKVLFVGYDLFTNEKIEESCAPSGKIEVPEVTKTEYTVADIDGDDLILIDDDGDTIEDLSLPDDEYLNSEIRRLFEEEKEFMVTVLSAGAKQQITFLTEGDGDDAGSGDEESTDFLQTPARGWSAVQVGQWIRTQDEVFHKFADEFVSRCINGTELMFINENNDTSTLEELGFKGKMRMREFKKLLKTLFEKEPAVPASLPAPRPAAAAVVPAEATKGISGGDFLAALKASDPVVGNPVIGNHHATGPRGLQEALDAAEFHDAAVLERLRRWDVQKKINKAVSSALKGHGVNTSEIKLLITQLEDDTKVDNSRFGLADPTVPGRGALLELFRSYVPDDDVAVQVVDKVISALKISDTVLVQQAAAAPEAPPASASASVE
jgi:translation initiation factor 5A